MIDLLDLPHHLCVLAAQVLQLLLHALQRLQEVIVLLGQPLVLFKHGLHLALCFSHPFQLDRGTRFTFWPQGLWE